MTISKATVDSTIRASIFENLMTEDYTKINDRQYGIIVTDLNGNERYVRIGIIVAEEREDMTARELMQSEIDKYNEAQSNKLRRAAERAEKAKREKEKREVAKKEKGE